MQLLDQTRPLPFKYVRSRQTPISATDRQAINAELDEVLRCL